MFGLDGLLFVLEGHAAMCVGHLPQLLINRVKIGTLAHLDP